MRIKYDRELLMNICKSISDDYQMWYDKNDKIKILKEVEKIKQVRKKYFIFGELVSDADGLTDDQIRDLAIKRLDNRESIEPWREYTGCKWKRMAEHMYKVLECSISQEVELTKEDELYLVSLYKQKG